MPGLLFGTVGVLAPLRLDDLGAGAGVIGAAFLAAGALESGVSPVVGRVSDRRGRLFPCLIALAAGATLMLLFPLPQQVWQLILLVVLAAPTIGMLWAPAMAMLSDGAEALGIAQGFAFALSNLGWSMGYTIGAAAQRGARRRHQRRRALPAPVRDLRRDARLPRPRPTAIAAAHVTSFWLDQPGPDRRPPLDGLEEADLVVVGGGLTGLWGALQAAEEGKRVVLLEGERLAFGASGRNGGFCSASLTHGIGNGLARWPDELAQLERMGRENLAGIRAAIERHGIDCGWRERGEIAVATAEHQLPWLEEEAELLRAHGWDAELLDGPAMRAQVNSPTFLGGLWTRDVSALVDPVRLCWGLARAAEAAGARICEGTPVTALARDGAGVRAETPGGRVLARGALLGDERLPAARARDRALRRARLRLRAGDRAAVGGAARRGRLGRAARGSPT